MAQSKGNGAGVAEFVTGSLVSNHNLSAVLIDTGADLRTEDDATREAVERALQFIQPLMYEVQDAGNGIFLQSLTEVNLMRRLYKGKSEVLELIT